MNVIFLIAEINCYLVKLSFRKAKLNFRTSKSIILIIQNRILPEFPLKKLGF